MKYTLLFFSAIAALKTVSACRPDCWAEELGYPCCEPTNDEILFIDEKGNEWGMENGKQCGILVYNPLAKGCGGRKEPQECDPEDCLNVMAVGEDGTLWGVSSKTKAKCYMNTEDKTCKKNIQNTCWSALLGYPCCKEAHKDLYRDKDGLWSIEDGKWCGIEYCPNCSSAEVESIDKYQNIWSTDKLNNKKCIINKNSAECSFYLNSKCRSATIGYMCCKETKETVLRDSFGFWGIENGKWCGFNERYPCDYYEKNGFTCCKETSEPVEVNKDGIFGKEDGQLCGLPYDNSNDY
jgi:hypothetical protein